MVAGCLIRAALVDEVDDFADFPSQLHNVPDGENGTVASVSSCHDCFLIGLRSPYAFLVRSALNSKPNVLGNALICLLWRMPFECHRCRGLVPRIVVIGMESRTV
jgi:hypothetical protein